MKPAHVEVGQVWECKRGQQYAAPFKVEAVSSLYVFGTGVEPPHRHRMILRSSFTGSGYPYRLVGAETAADATTLEGAREA
jgi:hypothetical protein